MSLDQIKQRITRAVEAVAPPAAGIKTPPELIAVSKVQPDERVRAVLAQGHRCFGENRVQEAAQKWPNFRAEFSGIDLHLLGPLRSNKARQAMQLFDVIHSLDRPKLAAALARLAQELGQCPKLFIQVNTGSEPQKAGILNADCDAFIADCRALDLPIIATGQSRYQSRCRLLSFNPYKQAAIIIEQPYPSPVTRFNQRVRLDHHEFVVVIQLSPNRLV